MKNEMNVMFLARSENVMFARSVAVAFLINLDVSLSIANEIKTVISEAVTNAIVHGYQNDDTKMVMFKMMYDSQKIWIEISDDGIGIADVEQAREPLFSTREDEERAGLGFTIMEVFMDELQIESKVGSGTKITMIKRLQGGTT